MNLQEKIAAVIDPALEFKGYGLVQVRLYKMGQEQIVSVDIDKLDDSPVSIDDCTEANRLISVLLDVEDFIKGSYTLEVGSPGEVRPLSKISDFERFGGRSAKVTLRTPMEGEYHISGKLAGVKREGETVLIGIQTSEGADLEVPYENIKKASIKRVF